MLHNTGPYGPNETPVNMAAPVNMTPTGHMSVVNNINHLAKLGHGNPPTANAAYGLGDYAVYHHQHFNMGAQMPQYPNHQYQQLGFQHSFPGHNPGSNSEGFQNGMLPMNLNIHSNHNAHTMNYQYDKGLLETVRPEVKEQTIRKVPLNIPQIPNKSLFNNDYVHNDSFQNPNCNLDLSMKSQGRVPLDNTRRKKIENTVKLIENILINSANMPKTIPKDVSSEKHYDVSCSKTNYAMDITKTTHNAFPNNTTAPSTTNSINIPIPTTNATKILIPTSKISLLNIKPVQIVPSMSGEKTILRLPSKPDLPNTNINASCSKTVPSSSNTSTIFTPAKCTTVIFPSTILIPLKKKPATNTNESSITEEVDPLSLTQEQSRHNERETDTLDAEDVKPIDIPLEIGPVGAEMDLKTKSVEIKIENASWIETDYAQPFIRDSNALNRNDLLNWKIIDGDKSVGDAIDAIKNKEPESNLCYECPHCSVLIKNPKRFLIHTRWHTFGLTNEKRLKLMMMREEKRIQLKEAKRLYGSDEKGRKVMGKSWPCKDCDKVFTAKGTLKNHRQRKHPTRIRECKVCHKSVIGWVAMRRHMDSHTTPDPGPGFQCHECPKRFKYAHSLAKHSDTHLEKIHACAVCPKKFGSQNLLKMHMKTHERHLRGAKFRCTYCAKAFFESYSLQVHERTHRNERPFVCTICNTSYGTNSSLKRHLKVSHSTSKPWECSVCHRSFSTERIRDRHEQRLHGKPEDFKFPCTLCECKYLKDKDLQKHMYKAHPKRKRKTDSDEPNDTE